VDQELKAETRADGSAWVVRAAPFSAILGQDAALGVLQNSLASQRVHHAWVFHGPRGVGKFTCAVAFGAALLDPDARPGKDGRVEFNPSGGIGRLLAAGSHPDLHVITKELAVFSDEKKIREAKQTSIPKDVVEKHLLIPAALAPAMRTGSRASKVFIVDEADLLDRSPFNAPVQNSILKMLEEPPEGTVIILVTDSEDRLLATIRSRCQRVAFRTLETPVMERWLAGTDLAIVHAQRRWLIEYAAGSPGVLTEAVHHSTFAWHEQLSPMLRAVEEGRFVLELGGSLSSCVESWADSWVDIHKNASKEAANRDGAAKVLHLVAEHFRRGLGSPLGGGPHLAAIEAIANCERHIDSNVQVPLAMGNLSAQLAECFVSATAR